MAYFGSNRTILAAMAAPPPARAAMAAPPPARVQARLVFATAVADADASENSEAEHSRLPPNRRGEGKEKTLKRAATGKLRRRRRAARLR